MIGPKAWLPDAFGESFSTAIPQNMPCEPLSLFSLGKLLCANCSVQVFCTSCPVQVALRKWLCASCSVQVVLCARDAQSGAAGNVLCALRISTRKQNACACCEGKESRNKCSPLRVPVLGMAENFAWLEHVSDTDPRASRESGLGRASFLQSLWQVHHFRIVIDFVAGRRSTFARSGTDFVAGAELSYNQVKISWHEQGVSWQEWRGSCRLRGRRCAFARSDAAAQ